jgi:hypothetical protein
VDLSPEPVAKKEEEVAVAEAAMEGTSLDSGQTPSHPEAYCPGHHTALHLDETMPYLAVRHHLFHLDHHRNCLAPTPM